MTTPLVSKQSHVPKTNSEEQEAEDHDYAKTYKKYNELLQTLPKRKGWTTEHIVQYQGYWLNQYVPKAALLLQNHFKARPTDVFLAAFLKCGTTWLRTLLFATMNRSNYEFSDHPLLKTGPHGCFPCIDTFICNNYPIADCEVIPSPRLFATHLPFQLFPQSSKASGSKFVYIWRDPKDVLVSMWHFLNNIKAQELPYVSLDEAFEMFCGGTIDFGPFWDHVLGYWKARLESPDKVLFLKYEDVKRDTGTYVKKLGEFLGCPFSPVEVRDGVVDEIVKLCSFENLTSLEVNKTGIERFNDRLVIENRKFFRKGEVEDHKNYLTKEMIERLDQITREKFEGSGLTF